MMKSWEVANRIMSSERGERVTPAKKWEQKLLSTRLTVDFELLIVFSSACLDLHVDILQALLVRHLVCRMVEINKNRVQSKKVLTPASATMQEAHLTSFFPRQLVRLQPNQL